MIRQKKKKKVTKFNPPKPVLGMTVVFHTEILIMALTSSKQTNEKGEKEVKRWFFSLRRQKWSSISVYTYIHTYLCAKIKPNIFKLSSIQKRGEGSSHLLWWIRDRVSIKNKENKNIRIGSIWFSCPILKGGLCFPNLTVFGEKEHNYFFKSIKQDRIF